ncbi:MAG TPA: RsmD family RNA methyltransferase [Geminicoccaceae bacterium]|nr:RsmD family RNA methyltransferase [Geminicoccus sp.]HMU52465.1 RsmD family RNA methyltransferase [Geminicoccaceae bacterium]
MTTRPGAEVELEIAALGSMGDGVARLAGEPVWLATTLPGERWRARLLSHRRDGWTAEPVERLTGGERAQPACCHFANCGGCRLQHAPADVYSEFKRRRIVEALRRRGLVETVVAEPVVSPPHSRRRLRLAWTRGSGAVSLGLRQRRSHAVVDLAECPVARPRLVAAMAPLRAMLAEPGPLARQGEASLTDTAMGVDLLLDAARAPTLEERERLAGWAERMNLARLALAIDGVVEIVVSPRPPAVVLSGVAVALPPRAFLQATGEGESALCAGVAAAVRRADRVVDLFAGLGTLALAALAAGARSVQAVEAAEDACAALAAARRPGLSVERRDLARRPLLAAELKRFDVAVLDPPRAGAVAQTLELARSEVPRIVYASCDPESFARDARLLVEGGYLARTVQPVDQFLWSAEVELVATFHRPLRRGRA